MTDFSAHKPDANGLDYVQKGWDLIDALESEFTTKNIDTTAQRVSLESDSATSKYFRAHNDTAGFMLYLNSLGTECSLQKTNSSGTYVHNLIKMKLDGETIFHHEGNEVFQTGAEGVEVTGTGVADRNIKVFDDAFGGIALTSYATASKLSKVAGDGAITDTFISMNHGSGVTLSHANVGMVGTASIGLDVFGGAVKYKSYTIAALKALTASSYSRCTSWCSDLAGGAGPVYCNGTIWIDPRTNVEIA